MKIINYGEYYEVKNHEVKRDKEYYEKLTKQRLQTQEANNIYGFNKCLDDAQSFGNKFGIKIKNMTLEKRRQDSIRRTRKLFKELLLCNIPLGNAWLVTLTYKKPVFDYDVMLKDYSSFKKRLARDKFDYKAITVPQLHDAKRTKEHKETTHTNSYHIHIIMFEVPNIKYKYLIDMWGHGAVFIKPINKKQYENINKLTNYLTGYLAKERLDKNKKTYFTTRNLKRPSIIEGQQAIKFYDSLKKDGHLLEDLSKSNSLYGRLTHKYYNMTK